MLGTSDVEEEMPRNITAEEEAEFEEFAQFSNEQEFFQALGETPLVKNPFFIRQVADAQFNGDGTEGIVPGKSENGQNYNKQKCFAIKMLLAVLITP